MAEECTREREARKERAEKRTRMGSGSGDEKEQFSLVLPSDLNLVEVVQVLVSVRRSVKRQRG